MPLPTFVIMGAQKCGTTTLSGYLRRHPQVSMSSPKELHYFDRPRKRSLDWYAAQFTPGPHHLAWGEATPSYLYRNGARRRCAAALPSAKFVVLLRDPAKRAYSHYWHSRRRGTETVETFEKAIDLEAERLADRTYFNHASYSYLARGRYATQLKAFAQLTGRDRIHVALLGDLVNDRTATLSGIFEFLGVDPTLASSMEPHHANRYRVISENGTPEPADYPPMLPSTRARVIEDLAPDIRELQDWLGRDLGAWLSV